jgi:hypothetical protein
VRNHSSTAWETGLNHGGFCKWNAALHKDDDREIRLI